MVDFKNNMSKQKFRHRIIEFTDGDVKRYLIQERRWFGWRDKTFVFPEYYDKEDRKIMIAFPSPSSAENFLADYCCHEYHGRKIRPCVRTKFASREWQVCFYIHYRDGGKRKTHYSNDLLGMQDFIDYLDHGPVNTKRVIKELP